MAFLADFEKRQCRELAFRTDGFSTVRLSWNERESGTEKELMVHYSDKEGRDFYLYPPKDRALEAFSHPLKFANHALNGKLPVAA